MDINLLLEPRGSESPAGNKSTTSVASSTAKAWTDASTLPTHTNSLINVTTSPAYDGASPAYVKVSSAYVAASPAYSASAPIPSSSPTGPLVQEGPLIQPLGMKFHQQQVQPDLQHPQTISPYAPPPPSTGCNIIGPPPLQTTKRAASQTPLPEESPAKKQSKWTQEEDNLTIELRGTGMKWDDIAKRIPGRSSISCRLRYQNYLEKRAVWDEEKKNKLARLYARFKDQMWQKVASEMQIPWRSAESMHWQLGEQEMSMRANAPVFQLHPSATGATSTLKGAPATPHFVPLSVSVIPQSPGSGNGSGSGSGGQQQQQQHHQGQKPGSPQPSSTAAQEQLL